MIGLEEHCYRRGCPGWVTGWSDYCSRRCSVLRAIRRRAPLSPLQRAWYLAAIVTAAVAALGCAAQSPAVYLTGLIGAVLVVAAGGWFRP